MNNTRQPTFKQGIVIVKTHPNLKFGQVVYIIEETVDLYKVKVHTNQPAHIISKTDLKLN